VVCLEFTKGKRRVYRRKPADGEKGFDVTDDQVGKANSANGAKEEIVAGGGGHQELCCRGQLLRLTGC
jgi:hypothetical protein